MDLEKIKEHYINELVQQDWREAYYTLTKRSERKAVLETVSAQEGNTPELQLIEQLYAHRYTPRRGEPAAIDHGIKAVVELGFLEKSVRPLIPRKGYKEKVVTGLLEDMGKFVCEPFGSLGEEVWMRELRNIARTYIELCTTDKRFNSAILGLGKIKDITAKRKILSGIVRSFSTLPRKEKVYESFEEPRRAFFEVYLECFPDMKSELEEKPV